MQVLSTCSNKYYVFLTKQGGSGQIIFIHNYVIPSPIPRNSVLILERALPTPKHVRLKYLPTHDPLILFWMIIFLCKSFLVVIHIVFVCPICKLKNYLLYAVLLTHFFFIILLNLHGKITQPSLF